MFNVIKLLRKEKSENFQTSSILNWTMKVLISLLSIKVMHELEQGFIRLLKL